MNDSEVEAKKLIEILDKIFDVPEDTMELLSLAGLTERQSKAILLFAEGENIKSIAKKIANGSKFTQNAYDAIGISITKIFESIILVKVLTQNKNIMSEILKRGLNYKRKISLDYR